MARKKISIDLLADGVNIDVPFPKGNCGTCKYNGLQVFIGDQYIHQPQHPRCKKCNIANGMKRYVESPIEWLKLTTLTEENPVVRDDLLKTWKKRSECGW